MSKETLNRNISSWIQNSLPEIHQVQIKKIFIKENISKISELENYISGTSFFDFVADYTLLCCGNGNHSIGLIQTCSSSISLKDIGIAQVYARISNPLFYYLISPKGFSKEASFLFGNDNLCSNMFCYDGKYVVGFKMKDNARIDIDSVLPLGIFNEW